jgi:hypothetical protein
MSKRISLVGRTFTRLEVVADAPIHVDAAGRKYAQSQCKCSCGNLVLVLNCNPTAGRTGSCGCLWQESITKHGHTGTSTYRSWQKMIQRRTNINLPQFKDWGVLGRHGRAPAEEGARPLAE